MADQKKLAMEIWKQDEDSRIAYYRNLINDEPENITYALLLASCYKKIGKRSCA